MNRDGTGWNPRQKEIIVIDDTPEPPPSQVYLPEAPANNTRGAMNKRRKMPEGTSNAQSSTQNGCSYTMPTLNHLSLPSQPMPYDSMVTYGLPISYPATDYSAASSSSLGQLHFSNPLVNCDYRSSYTSPYMLRHVPTPSSGKRKRDDYADYQHDVIASRASNALGTSAARKIARTQRKQREVALRKEYAPEIYNGGGRSCDDQEGHYIIVPNSDLTHRYTIDKQLGQGTFGKVVRAYDRHKRAWVAIKIIRAVQKYRDASMIELRVLRTLQENDPRNTK